MGEILRAEGLRKTFKLSAKQQKLEKTKEKIKSNKKPKKRRKILKKQVTNPKISAIIKG